MFHKNLKELRERNVLLRSELGEKVGVDAKMVKQWEKGLAVPDTPTFMKLLEILQVEADILLGVRLSEKKTEEEVAWELDKLQRAVEIRAKRARKTQKNVWEVIIVIIALNIFVALASVIVFVFLKNTTPTDTNETVIETFMTEEETIETEEE